MRRSIRRPVRRDTSSVSAASALPQPEIVERLGAQPARDLAHLLEALAHRLARLLDLAAHRRLRVERRPLELQDDRGQRLADLVVQLARDPRALTLLRRQRPPRAVAPLALQPLDHLVERPGQLRHLGVRRLQLARAPPASAGRRRA